MTIANYADLKAAVADFLFNRDDLANVSGEFIRLAEARIARDLRHWKQEKRVTTNIDEQYENLPTDWIRIDNVSHAAGGLISSISASEMEAKRAASTTAGKPRYMRISANQIEFYPVPDQTCEIKVDYLAKTPNLTDAAPSNWLIDYAPDILLYGALMHSAPYLGEDARVAVWGGMYQSGIESLNSESKSATVAGPLKMGIPR